MGKRKYKRGKGPGIHIKRHRTKQAHSTAAAVPALHTGALIDLSPYAENLATRKRG